MLWTLAPAMNNTANVVGTNTMAVPKSGCMTIKSPGAPEMIPVMMSACHVRMIRLDRYKK